MFYLALLFLFLIAVFGGVSISQAYASAKQSQAAIEASQTAQLALRGQITIGIVLTLVVAILAFTVVALFYKLNKKQEAMSLPPYLPVSELRKKDYPALDDTDVHQVSLNHKEDEFYILPDGWGW